MKRPGLLLAPAVLVLGGLFLAALGLTLLRSLRYMPSIGLTQPDLAAYAAVLTAPGFLASLQLSLWIALASTAVSGVLGLGVALFLRRQFAGRGGLAFLVHLNLTVPHVVGAVGILYLFAQSGLFARLAYGGGLIAGPAEFPALTQDPFAIGIILLYVWKEAPFVAVVLLAKLQTIGQDHEATARSLGATRWQALVHVLLPLLSPALFAALALVFAFAFGAYEVPLLLGAHAPKALPVLAWQSYTDVDLAARPQAMAMAILIALIGLAMLLAYARLAVFKGPDRDAR
jgi:putative spermidine/putrescine transport system permease protein